MPSRVKHNINPRTWVSFHKLAQVCKKVLHAAAPGRPKGLEKQVRQDTVSPAGPARSEALVGPSAMERVFALPELRKMIQERMAPPDFLRSKRLASHWLASAQTADMHLGQLAGFRPAVRGEPRGYDVKKLQDELAEEVALRAHIASGTGRVAKQVFEAAPRQLVVAPNRRFVGTLIGTRWQRIAFRRD